MDRLSNDDFLELCAGWLNEYRSAGLFADTIDRQICILMLSGKEPFFAFKKLFKSNTRIEIFCNRMLNSGGTDCSVYNKFIAYMNPRCLDTNVICSGVFDMYTGRKSVPKMLFKHATSIKLIDMDLEFTTTNEKQLVLYLNSVENLEHFSSVSYRLLPGIVDVICNNLNQKKTIKSLEIDYNVLNIISGRVKTCYLDDLTVFMMHRGGYRRSGECVENISATNLVVKVSAGCKNQLNDFLRWESRGPLLKLRRELTLKLDPQEYGESTTNFDWVTKYINLVTKFLPTLEKLVIVWDAESGLRKKQGYRVPETPMSKLKNPFSTLSEEIRTYDKPLRVEVIWNHVYMESPKRGEINDMVSKLQYYRHSSVDDESHLWTRTQRFTESMTWTINIRLVNPESMVSKHLNK